MSSQNNTTITGSYRNGLGVMIPARFVPLLTDCKDHPEKGRFIDSMYESLRQINSQAHSLSGNTNIEQQIKPKRPPSSKKIKLITSVSEAEGGFPKIEGSVFIGNQVINCSGYLVSASEDCIQLVAIVLDVPDLGWVPCACPSELIDNKYHLELMANTAGLHFQIRQSTQKIEVVSTRGHILGVPGHLLISASTRNDQRDVNIKGRAVDTCMLESLQVGCLRIGESSDTFFTLDRKYAVQKSTLMHNAKMVLDTDDGMELIPAGRLGVDAMMDLGETALQRRLKHHESMKEAISELKRAGNLGEPPLEEKLLQISIGGDPAMMMVGKFIPCRNVMNNPEIDANKRCACGFVGLDVSIMVRKEVKSLLRPMCKR